MTTTINLGAAGIAAAFGSALAPVADAERQIARHIVQETRRAAARPQSSKYRPHQGERERQRRLRQMAKA